MGRLRSFRRRMDEMAARGGKRVTGTLRFSRKAGPKTFWNGEPCQARRVRVIVGESPAPTWWWCFALAGQIREAVEVRYGDQLFYLDNEDDSGWLKVTEGKGSPGWSHRSLPVEQVLEERR
jgi:hypothetical protein